MRQYIHQQLASLSQREKERQSRLVGEQLVALIAEKDIQTIALYSALSDEVDVNPVIEACLAQGKTVLLPKIINEGSMIVSQIHLGDDLVLGAFDILEPADMVARNDTVDMIVIPGRAFDLTGGRVGRGRGYYDRLLQHHPTSLKVGVCFAEQVVDEVPVDEWDVKMNRLICLM